MTMTLNKIEIFEIIDKITQGDAPKMPEDAWYPERASNIQDRIKILFDNTYSQREEYVLTLEDAQDENLVLSPEQALYAITTANAYQLYDQYKKVHELSKLKGGSQEDKDSRQAFKDAFDHTIRWLMDNAPDHFIVFWAKTVLSIFKAKFDPTGMKNWDEFVKKYQDLILEAISE